MRTQSSGLAANPRVIINALSWSKLLQVMVMDNHLNTNAHSMGHALTPPTDTNLNSSLIHSRVMDSSRVMGRSKATDQDQSQVVSINPSMVQSLDMDHSQVTGTRVAMGHDLNLGTGFSVSNSLTSGPNQATAMDLNQDMDFSRDMGHSNNREEDHRFNTT